MNSNATGDLRVLGIKGCFKADEKVNGKHRTSLAQYVLLGGELFRLLYLCRSLVLCYRFLCYRLLEHLAKK